MSLGCLSTNPHFVTDRCQNASLFSCVRNGMYTKTHFILASPLSLNEITLWYLKKKCCSAVNVMLTCNWWDSDHHHSVHSGARTWNLDLQFVFRRVMFTLPTGSSYICYLPTLFICRQGLSLPVRCFIGPKCTTEVKVSKIEMVVN